MVVGEQIVTLHVMMDAFVDAVWCKSTTAGIIGGAAEKDLFIVYVNTLKNWIGIHSGE